MYKDSWTLSPPCTRPRLRLSDASRKKITTHQAALSNDLNPHIRFMPQELDQRTAATLEAHDISTGRAKAVGLIVRATTV